jgi:hypothetical protein
MQKTYAAPAPFSDKKRPEIPLQPVKSSQVKAIGYDAETKTLAVQFTRGAGAIYHYPNVEPDTHKAFVGAPSIGGYFGKHIKPLRFEKFAPPAAHTA